MSSSSTPADLPALDSVDLTALTFQVAVDTAQLASLCRDYEVELLDVFGSAITPEFDADRSDVDLVVRFRRPISFIGERGSIRFQERLAALFGRPIDLVEMEYASNPCFVAAVNRTRRPLYRSGCE